MSRGKLKMQFDTADLIDLIEEQPCLWDTTSEMYMDKSLKETAWRDVCCHLFEDFDSFNEENKKCVAKTVTDKWKNIRDALVRSLKRKKPGLLKKYVYFNQLQFLIKILEKNETDNTDSSVTADGDNDQSVEAIPAIKCETLDVKIPRLLVDCDNDQSDEDIPLSKCKAPENKTPRFSSTKFAKISYSSPVTNTDAAVVTAVETISKPSVSSTDCDDMLFFKSVLPSIVHFTEDDKLDFRMDVLALIRKYRRKRTC